MLKRLKRVCFLVMTCIFALITLTACGDRAISNLEIKENTLKYTYEQGETVSFEGLVVIAKYNDDTTEEIKFGDDGLTVSSLSTETKGKKKLTIDYKGTSITVEITVVEPSDTTKLIRKINSLPSVENITLDNKNAIVELRATYNSLSDTEKGKITNYSVLQAAEAKIAELELNSYKASKKIEISSYKTSSNYSTEGWAKIQQIIATANAEIDAAASNDGVNAAITKAKAAMDQIQTSVEELLAYKNAKKQELADYADEEDYSASNWTQVQTIITNGTSNINAATSKEAVDQALEDAKASIDEIDTKADELQAYKNAKKQELQNYKNQEDYSIENWATIQDYISQACALIDIATSNQLVDSIVSSTKENINNVKVIAVTNVEDLIDALPTEIQISDKAAIEAARAAYNALSSANRNLVKNREKLEAAEVRYAELDFEGYKTSKKQELDSYVNLENYKDSNKTIINNYINAAKEAIDEAENRTQVDNAVSSAKTNIDSVKVKRITDVEDEIESISIDDLTLSNESKEVVSAARAHYDALDENDRSLVGNYAKLQNAEARLAQLQLNKDKENAKEELNTYKVETNYNSTKWSEIQNIITEASARIDAATDKANINLIVSNAKANIDNVKTLDITTVEDKIDVIPDASSLSLADESKITEARNAYNALADDTLKGKVSNLSKLQEAETRLAELKLEKAKEDAKLALDTYKDEDNYSPSAWKLVLNHIENGKKAIDEETTVSGVATALETAKSNIDSVPDKDTEDHYVIQGWEAPKSMASRNDTKFNIKSKTYVVGNDNDFVFKPNITATYSKTQPTLVKETINEYRTASKIYKCDDEACATSTLLEGENLSNYVEDIGEYTFSYKFSQAAEGNVYKIEIRPYWQQDDFVQSIVVKVVDGYNVTNAKELGVMTNYHDSHDGKQYEYVEAWKTFLGNNGITKTTSNGIILHDNITITIDDLPSIFFDKVGTTTYLDDYVIPYTHQLEANETFGLYGNYFTIDASEMPLINTVKADGNVSHTALFKFRLNEINCAQSTCNYSDTTNASMVDVNIRGNNPKFYDGEGNERDAETDSEKNAGYGGLIMEKPQYLNMTIDNSIVEDFFINLYADNDTRNSGKLTIKNSIATNAFQNILFSYGGMPIDIIDSTLEKCGGPAIIAQHLHPDSSDDMGMPPVINITNSKVESYVTGSENWFTAFKDKVAGIIALNTGIFSNFNSFIREDGKMNIVGVFMSQGYTITDLSNKSQGKLTIDNKIVTNKMDDGTSTIFTKYNSIKSAYENGLPVFETDEGAAAYFTGTALENVGGNIYSTTAKYLTIYQSGVYIVVELQGKALIK